MSEAPFHWGVASGDVTATSVVIWTRVAASHGEDRLVHWDVRTTDEGRIVARGTTTASADDDHTVHVDVDGLAPATDYEYRFAAGAGHASGRTRTLPEGAIRLRFVVVCCSRWGWPGFERYGAVVDEDPAFVLHLGDSIYELGETPPSGVTTDPPWSCHTLSDYRRRHRQHHAHPALRRLLASVPVIATWDDHEVVDNAPDPGTAERRRAGQQAWREWTPMRNEPGSVNRFVTVDGLVDLALLDARFAGRRPDRHDGPGDAGSGAGHILAARQWRLLGDFARSAGAPWFVFANQVQVGPMTLAARPVLGRPPWRRIVNPDQWDGYPGERDRLYHLLHETSGSVVVLSGDLHSSWSRSLRHGVTHVAHEFTSPSISGVDYATAVRERLPVPPGLLASWLRTLNPGIDWLDLVRNGFLVCDVTPDEFNATFVTHDGERHVVSLGH